MTYRLLVTPGNNSALVKKVLLMRGNWETLEPEQNLENQLLKSHFVWSPNSLDLRYYTILEEHIKQYPNKSILLNHFQNHRIITTKVNLIRTLRAYYSREEHIYSANYTVFSSTPTTFIISAGNEDKQFNDMTQRYFEIEKGNFNRERIPAKHCKQNLWLVKPANLNQGRGIQIFKNLKQITNFLASKPLNTVWVVQKYIQRPLLYNGRKFDIRVWVLVNNKCEIYFYRKGYIRTSSDSYSMDNFNNYVHLTNNCLQKYGSGYSKFQQGNTLPIQILQDYINSLQKYSNSGFELERDIIQRIKDLIIDTIVAGKKTFLTKKKQFQLFGYDFLVDEDLRTWLIEVNTNPYLGVPNDYIKNLLDLMIDDMLKLTVDQMYPPKNKNIFSDTNNFELIYSQQVDKNLRSLFTKNVYPIQGLAPPPNKLKKSEDTEDKKAYKEYNIEQHLKWLMDNYNYSDLEPLHKPVSRIISNLSNWQLQTEEFRQANCKWLRTVSQSKFNSVFCQQNYIQSLVKIIDSQNFPKEIQLVAIETIMGLCKNIQTKKKVISPLLITCLVKIAMAMFGQSNKFDQEVVKKSIKCLIALAGVYQIKYFIPGQTRENQLIRQLFIKYNGLCVLLLCFNDQDLKAQIQEFLEKLDQNQWEYQLTLLNEQQSQSSLMKTKLLQRINKGEESLSVTAPLIAMHKHKILKIAQQKYQQLKQLNTKKQIELKEKRQKFEMIQLKIKEQKQKLNMERRLRAEEYIRKKNQERIKLRIEQQKKASQLKLIEEQRKKKLSEDIQKRKQQLKYLRNDSRTKIQEKEKQSKDKEKQKIEQKKKYTNQQRNRILSQWLINKKQEEKRKRDKQKQDEIKRAKLMEQRKIQIQRRIQKLKEKQKLKVKSTESRLTQNKQEDQIYRIIFNTKSKSRFPKVPKSDKQVVHQQRQTPRNIQHHPTSTFKDPQLEELKKRQTIPRMLSYHKYQNQEQKAFKYFMNALRKAARSKTNKTFANDNNQHNNSIDDHFKNHQKVGQFYSLKKQSDLGVIQEQLTKKMVEKQKSFSNKTQEKYHTYGLDKKQKARLVVEFLLSSPYSGFVRKHYKIKQLMEQLQKYQN